MHFERTLEKAGKTASLTATDLATAEQLVQQSKARLKQGWTPVGGDVLALAKHLEALGLEPWQFIAAFSEAEVATRTTPSSSAMTRTCPSRSCGPGRGGRCSST